MVYNCKENSIIHLSKDEKVVIKNPLPTKKVSLYYILFELKQGFSMDILGVEKVINDTNGKLLSLCRDIYKTHLSEGAAYKIKAFGEFTNLLYELVTYKLNTDESFSVI